MVAKPNKQPEGGHHFGKPSKLGEIKCSCPFAEFAAEREERCDG